MLTLDIHPWTWVDARAQAKVVELVASPEQLVIYCLDEHEACCATMQLTLADARRLAEAIHQVVGTAGGG